MRDHYKYVLRDGRKIVYVGITTNPDQRETQHQRDKHFTSMTVEGRRTTQDAARKWERERLAQYRRNHQGKNPRYNNNQNG